MTDYDTYQREKAERWQQSLRDSQTQMWNQQIEEERARERGNGYTGGAPISVLKLVSVLLGGFFGVLLILFIAAMRHEVEIFPTISEDSFSGIIRGLESTDRDIVVLNDKAVPTKSPLTFGQYEELVEEATNPVDGYTLATTQVTDSRTLYLLSAYGDAEIVSVTLVPPAKHMSNSLAGIPVATIELHLLTEGWDSAFTGVDADSNEAAAAELASLIFELSKRGLIPVAGVVDAEAVAFKELTASVDLQATLWESSGTVVSTQRLDGRLMIVISLPE